jgi:preprotein translocase subunit SecD
MATPINSARVPGDHSSIGFGILGFLIPIAGLILFLVWKDQMPKKAKSAGLGALIGVIAYVAVVILVYVFTTDMITTTFVNQGRTDSSAPAQTEEKSSEKDVYILAEAEQGFSEDTIKKTIKILNKRVDALKINCDVINVDNKQIKVEFPREDIEKINRLFTKGRFSMCLPDGTEVINESDIKFSTIEQNSNSTKYVVKLEFTSGGRKKFYTATEIAYNREIEQSQIMQSRTESIVVDKQGRELRNTYGFTIGSNQIIVVIDDEIISAPQVNNGPVDSKNAFIEKFNYSEATDISLFINDGSLPVSLIEVESGELY